MKTAGRIASKSALGIACVPLRKVRNDLQLGHCTPTQKGTISGRFFGEMFLIFSTFLDCSDTTSVVE